MEATKFVTEASKGSLFAHADKDTGEIVKISGKYVTSEGITVYLKGELLDTGAISLTGEMEGHSRVAVAGLLIPQGYDADYKMGTLQIGKKSVKLNSKTKLDRNGAPYRFVWTTNNTARVAC